jgi:hypothetical protein
VTKKVIGASVSVCASAVVDANAIVAVATNKVRDLVMLLSPEVMGVVIALVAARRPVRPASRRRLIITSAEGNSLLGF